MSNFNICKSKSLLIIVIVATSLTEAMTFRQAEVLVNESASISCFSKEVKNIQWHHTPPGKKSNEYVYAGGKLYSPYDTGRFRVDNNLTTNMYTLIITNVMHEDAGLYECKDDVLSGVFGSSTHLTVLDSGPVCTSNMNPNGFVGPNTCNIGQETMTFSCAVSFSGNSPNLTWSTLNGSQASNSSICERKDNRINCSLSMKADPSFDGSAFICQTTTSNDARYNCSIKDVRVEYFLGKYEVVEKRVDDNATCMIASNLQINYNWTIQQNNQDKIFSANRTISVQTPGFYECRVKYNIRNVTCYAPIAAVIAGNIVHDKETAAESSHFSSRAKSNDLAKGVSIGFFACLLLVAVIACIIYWKRYVIYRRLLNGRSKNEECSLQLIAGTTPGKHKNGLAYSYFFGYLQIIIEGFYKSFVTEIQNSSAAKEPTKKTFLVKKMLIIIPKTLRSPKKLTDEINIGSTNLFVKQWADRAGKERREYTIPIYKFTDTKSGNIYYIVADIPACLSAIREAYKQNFISMADVNETRDDFVLTLESLLTDRKNDLDFADQCELLVWPDDEKANNPMKISEFVCQQINMNKELAARTVKLADIPIQPITGGPILAS